MALYYNANGQAVDPTTGQPSASSETPKNITDGLYAVPATHTLPWGTITVLGLLTAAAIASGLEIAAHQARRSG